MGVLYQARQRRFKTHKPLKKRDEVETTIHEERLAAIRGLKKTPTPREVKPLVGVEMPEVAPPVVRITAEPDNCRVYVDNKKVGQTPVEIAPVEGDVLQVRVSKRGYKTARFELASGDTDKHITLER